METEEMKIENVKPTATTTLFLATIQRKEAIEGIWLLANLCSAVANGELKPEEMPKDQNDVLVVVMKYGAKRK